MAFLTHSAGKIGLRTYSSAWRKWDDRRPRCGALFSLGCSWLRLQPRPPQAAGPIVSAFYYPWFATNVEDGSYAHWAQDGHLPPNDISSVYYPALGVYSSDDPGVLDAQMAEIQRAGIDQIAVSWWGKGSPEDQRLPGGDPAATARHIDVAVHIEPYTGRSVASVVADIAYLGTLGVETFYIYQAFLIAPAAWAQANDALHAEGITTFAQTAFVGQAVVGHFSGIYTYDIVTWTAGKFPRICAEAHAHGLLCAPSVGPGYDARRATGDPTVKPRRGGLTYDSMWHAAIAARRRRDHDHLVQRVAGRNPDRAGRPRRSTVSSPTSPTTGRGGSRASLPKRHISTARRTGSRSSTAAGSRARTWRRRNLSACPPRQPSHGRWRSCRTR